jgi:hypothetical protein
VRYLALAAIELLIDRMGAGATASRGELIDYLADLARLQSRDLSTADATALADHVFDGLSVFSILTNLTASILNLACCAPSRCPTERLATV